MEDALLEFLMYELEHSGLLLNIPIKFEEADGVFLDINYEVDRELLEGFKKERAEGLFKEPKDTSKDYKGKLHDLLSWWIGNPAIVKSILSKIKNFSKTYGYDVYGYRNKKIVMDTKYRDILDEGAMYASVIIFESEKRNIAISVTWRV